ncbi:hypothetical protein PtA15_14A253 [Puccinia triticina]|uniref:Phytochrome chromophore attachment site domain-containing protein n=1 Tax=Puccinia triticina TaxID=208348 RepID=A0ABY7D5V5_9BASI|nr:uncharacterized protein PtA15_14A253 [Puccinia triticina]WAQ91370.1 hypothetical protein PtA15_14A253 [Puccinia triticina]
MSQEITPENLPKAPITGDTTPSNAPPAAQPTIRQSARKKTQVSTPGFVLTQSDSRRALNPQSSSSHAANNSKRPAIGENGNTPSSETNNPSGPEEIYDMTQDSDEENKKAATRTLKSKANKKNLELLISPCIDMSQEITPENLPKAPITGDTTPSNAPPAAQPTIRQSARKKTQSQLLCDNLEVCLDSANTSTAGPHTFRMSGRGGIGTGIDGPMSHTEWSCWCAAHRPDPVGRPRLVIIEFELENDELNPPSTVSVEPVDEDDRGGVAGKPYEPTEQDLIESTMSINKPLRALARLRRKGKDFSGDSVEVLSILSQLNNQFDKADDMPTFLKMAIGLVRELTGFDRVMIYKFDESWNGQVIAELVDWKRTRNLYRGLRFPASDIPAQARELYNINKVRMLYDRDQPTARLMCKSQEELSKPLNMTHCHLRAMSPIHIKYLANMGVQSSFSISIIMNDELRGLISCHSYGRFGQRVTFPTRQFCTMLGDTVSRNILRLNLSQRLQSRKLINTTLTSKNPSGYFVSKAEDLLWLFDAQSGVLSIGEEAKIWGTVSNSQEILAILEYLRVRKYNSIQVSTDINVTFPDIEYPGGFESISGVLVIPLSRSDPPSPHWAGNPHEKIMKDDKNGNILEPRKSFKIWSETVKERSKAWTADQLKTGSVLSLVYGKFIDVWRQKEAAVQNNQLQALLLSNASHEVRTPLHQILSTLELALDGQLDEDTRDNLSKSYTASRALVHVINDLLRFTMPV